MYFLYKLIGLINVSSPKKQYYSEDLKTKYRSLQRFQKVLKNLDFTTIQTEVPIGYDSTIEFGDSIFKVLRTKGIPNQWIRLKKFNNYEILQYKSSIYKLRIHDELHFINGKLMFFSNNFPYINMSHNNIIEILLREKYIPKFKNFHEITNFKICDQHNNFIYAQNVGHLSINYMTSDKKMQDKLYEYSTLESRKRSFRELMFKQMILEKI